MNRKKTVSAIITMLILFAAGLFPANFKEIDKTTQDGSTRATLQDSGGNQFVLVYDTAPSENVLNTIETFAGLAFSWSGMTVRSLTFSYKTLIEVVLVPQTYQYSGRNLKTSLPSGMTFYLDPQTAENYYDFRLQVERLFVRLKGVFTSRDNLSRQIAEAIDNPRAFIQKNDPDYFYDRFIEVDDTFDAVDRTVSGLDAKHNADMSAVGSQLEKYAEEFQKFVAVVDEEADFYLNEIGGSIESNAGAISALQESLDSLAGQLTLFSESINSLLDAHVTDYEKLREEYDTLAGNFDKLRRAVMKSQNTSFFTSKPVPDDTVAAVLALKASNAAITSKEIAAELKAQGVKASSKEIKIVLEVFFNEF